MTDIPLKGDRAAWDAAGYPEVHTNDTDTAGGIHHTLGTGANQAATGNHTHAGGGGDVIQDGAITVGNLAVFSADHHIQDGGAVPAGGGDVSKSGVTTDGHLAVWDGADTSTIKDGGAVPTGAGTPGDTVSDETTWDIEPDAGVSTDYSRADHTHGTPPEPAGGGGIPVSGWVAASGTWSFSSADDPTYIASVNADMSATIGVGMRIKLTQATGGTKYFIVTAVGAFAGGATLITMYGGTDYNLENEAISNPYYSPVKAPFGFPMDPDKWTVIKTDTTPRGLGSGPTPGTWYNIGTTNEQISVPIGCWHLSYHTFANIYHGTNVANLSLAVTLSTANNSESDQDFTCLAKIYGYSTNLVRGVFLDAHAEKTVNVASKTVYYLNEAALEDGDDMGVNDNYATGTAGEKTVLKAVCAYL